MNAKSEYKNQSLMNLTNRGASGAVALLLLLPVAAWAGGVVTNCTEANLRGAMAGGGTVTFACDGTITLTNTITGDLDVTLDGTGHHVAISGGGAVRCGCSPSMPTSITLLSTSPSPAALARAGPPSSTSAAL